MQPESAAPPAQATRPAVGFGVACALVGLAFGGAFSLFCLTTGGEPAWRFLFLPATLASFVAGTAAWRVIVGRRAPTALRGAAAGACASVAAQVLMFWASISGFWMAGKVGLVPLGRDQMNPLEAVAGAFVFALWGLLFFGIVTLPARAVAGALWGRRLRQRG